MAEPFNYSLNIPNPADAILKGVQLAGGVAQVRGAQAEAAGAEAANQRRTQFQAALAKINERPSAAGIASLSSAFPEFGAVIKESHDLLGAEEQKQNISDATAVHAAILSGDYELADQLLGEQTDALRNGGRETEAKDRDVLRKLVKFSPETGLTTSGLYLAKTMGAEKYVEAFSKLEGDRRSRDLEGATLTEAEAKADKAAVAAKYAESDAAIELEKKGFDIDKIKNDIQVSRENARIAAINSAIAKESSTTRREALELKKDQFVIKRDTAIREAAANAQSARGTIDNLLNTADQLLKTPIGVLDDITGTVDSKTFTFGSAEADAEELFKTLSAETFLAQVPTLKGTGALTEREGDKLEASLRSLSLRQSPQRLLNNLKEIQRLMLKARQTVTTRYGIPETVPDTPAAAPDDPELQAILDQYLFGEDDPSGNP